ncbi:hypothetical protein [Rhodococcus pyridinivorans]|uniref:hypothetical protein n=2 Tax=Rhodococcus TaxID=1827 RepID=UPI0011C3BB23|nr:hypothetical protein [Rhodococcus pyridinivorans]WAL49079.1 hypothetical protein OQN32_25565 [Rhodococcus pyridinivorans]
MAHGARDDLTLACSQCDGQQDMLGLAPPVDRSRVDEALDLAGGVDECHTAIAGDLPQQVLRLDDHGALVPRVDLRVADVLLDVPGGGRVP